MHLFLGMHDIGHKSIMDDFLRLTHFIHAAWLKVQYNTERICNLFIK